ncbi:MAG: hypothetical protein JW763_00260 [candidate division Zixibacteria bacterium]|nr:hypothetical protein [candidate division Zixibacteria bacterium]
MDYGKLVNHAFELSWKHKILWILGFFASTFFFSGSGLDEQIKSRPWEHWTELQLAILVLAVSAIVIIGLFLFIMQLISVAGLIEAVVRIENGQAYKLGEMFKVGARHFWRYLGLFCLFFLVTGSSIILLVGIIVLGFVFLHWYGLIILVLLLPILFAVIFFFGNMYSLAQREIVAGGLPVFDAVSEAYRLITRHLGPNIIMFFITFFLGIGIMLVGVLLLAAFAIPVLLVATVSTAALIVSLVIAIPVFLALAIMIEGCLGTFFNALFTLFYLELRKLTPRTMPTVDSTPSAQA